MNLGYKLLYWEIFNGIQFVRLISHVSFKNFSYRSVSFKNKTYLKIQMELLILNFSRAILYSLSLCVERQTVASQKNRFSLFKNIFDMSTKDFLKKTIQR